MIRTALAIACLAAALLLLCVERKAAHPNANWCAVACSDPARCPFNPMATTNEVTK